MFSKLARYAFIVFLKFIVVFYGLFSAYSYVLPDWVSGNLLSVVTWVIVFGISFGFATLAFHPGPPTRRDLVMLLIVWLGVTVTLLLGYGILFLSRGPRILYDRDILIQLAVEIVAIVLAAYVLRRRRLQSELGG